MGEVVSATDCPPFDEALDSFQAFLAKEGLSTNIIWIFREDVVIVWGHIYINAPAENAVWLVEQLYRQGQEVGLGIHLNTFCMLEGRPACYIWLPKDKTDAEYRMLSGLKLSIPAGLSRRMATPVANRLRWACLKRSERRLRQSSWADEIRIPTMLSMLKLAPSFRHRKDGARHSQQ